MAFPQYTTGEVLTSLKLNSRAPTTIVKKNSQRLASSTTLINDNDLYTTLDAGCTYEIFAVLSVSGTTGVDINVTWASVAGGFRSCFGVSDAATSGTSGNALAMSPISWPSAVRYGLTSRNTIIERGYVTIGDNPQLFNLQWAQWVSSTSAIKVHQGSFLKYRRVA